MCIVLPFGIALAGLCVSTLNEHRLALFYRLLQAMFFNSPAIFWPCSNVHNRKNLIIL